MSSSKVDVWNLALDCIGETDAERAAWVMAARALMNLDEFITRE